MKDIQWLLKELKIHFEQESTGHDYWHAERVWHNARRIGQVENVNLKIVEASALLHDVTDWKLSAEKREEGQKKMDSWLNELGYSTGECEAVYTIIDNMSFKGGTNQHIELSIEGQVVQDADRLDALGAIGIARTFAFGGSKGRAIHDPDEKPVEFEDFEAYKNHKGSSVNHFYEKLFKLKDLMNTEAGKNAAIERHTFMKGFLDQLYKEWDGQA